MFQTDLQLFLWGKSRVPKDADSTQEQLSQELIPGVAGKRLQMSVVNHRLL